MRRFRIEMIYFGAYQCLLARCIPCEKTWEPTHLLSRYNDVFSTLISEIQVPCSTYCCAQKKEKKEEKKLSDTLSMSLAMSYMLGYHHKLKHNGILESWIYRCNFSIMINSISMSLVTSQPCLESFNTCHK